MKYQSIITKVQILVNNKNLKKNYDKNYLNTINNNNNPKTTISNSNSKINKYYNNDNNNNNKTKNIFKKNINNLNYLNFYSTCITYSIIILIINYIIMLIPITGIMAAEIDHINMESRAKYLGYPLESYKVITDDGYVLTLFRMPSSKKCNISDLDARKKPVLIQHGLLVSSTSWLLSEANNSLPCLLADSCYDVWLGNFRGTNYSRLHTKFGSNSREFWDFSWHEMGVYDLPAMIDFILKVTRFKSLHYIGHSQGTTTFFVMASTRPKYNSKITSMQALAPVAYIGNLVSPILRLLGPMVGQPSLIVELLGDMLVVPSSRLLALMGYEACKKSSPLESICSNLMFLFVGYDTENFNKTLIPDIITTSVNAGASAKQLIHYGQIIASHKFREYDHGTLRNLFHYAQSSAPEYNLTKVTAPVYIYFGNNDWLTSIDDIRKLAVRLPNLKFTYKVPYARFNHLDFMFAENVTELVYNMILKNLNKYN